MKDIIKITSLSNAHIKELAKLDNAKSRDELGKVLVEGKHLVKEAYALGILCEVLFTSSDDYLESVDNYLVSEEIIKKLSHTTTPQGIIGVAKIKEKEIIYGDSLLLLDGVSDPGNLGTIIRTAKAFGVSSIILSEGSIDIYNDKVIRATQGQIFKMPIVKTNLKKVITELKNKGYVVYATSLKDAIDLEEVKEVNKYALVLGNEANGVSSEIIDLCDCSLKIKMEEDVESLNVAIAGAVCLYSLNNKRK